MLVDWPQGVFWCLFLIAVALRQILIATWGEKSSMTGRTERSIVQTGERFSFLACIIRKIYARAVRCRFDAVCLTGNSAIWSGTYMRKGELIILSCLSCVWQVRNRWKIPHRTFSTFGMIHRKTSDISISMTLSSSSSAHSHHRLHLIIIPMRKPSGHV